MLPVRGRDGRATRAARILGTRTAWTPVGDGEFFCPGCGGDRNYQRLTGRRRLTLLGVPRAAARDGRTGGGCAACAHHFGPEVLDHPTTRRFSAMLRDAVHTVALAVLAAGGTGSRTALGTAAAAVRAAGFADCTEDQLAALVEALAADTGRYFEQPCAAGLTIELHEALDPLAPHLAPAGRESLLLQAARIALADGPYTPAERDALATVGAALTICSDDVTRLLAAAPHPVLTTRTEYERPGRCGDHQGVTPRSRSLLAGLALLTLLTALTARQPRARRARRLRHLRAVRLRAGRLRRLPHPRRGREPARHRPRLRRGPARRAR